MKDKWLININFIFEAIIILDIYGNMCSLHVQKVCKTILEAIKWMMTCQIYVEKKCNDMKIEFCFKINKEIMFCEYIGVITKNNA